MLFTFRFLVLGVFKSATWLRFYNSVKTSGGQNDDFRPLTSTLGGRGMGCREKICDILRPQLAMNRFLTLWPHRFSHFGYINLGGGGVGGGSDIRSMSSIRPICKCRCPPLVKTPIRIVESYDKRRRLFCSSG